MDEHNLISVWLMMIPSVSGFLTGWVVNKHGMMSVISQPYCPRFLTIGKNSPNTKNKWNLINHCFTNFAQFWYGQLIAWYRPRCIIFLFPSRHIASLHLQSKYTWWLFYVYTRIKYCVWYTTWNQAGRWRLILCVIMFGYPSPATLLNYVPQPTGG